MSKYNYTDGQRVKFNTGGTVQGVGTVIGVSSSELPEIGCTYIIKVDECHHGDMSLPNDEYPFTTIAIPECFLSVNG